MSEQSILITGCNKRVGKDLAVHLLARGFRIIGTVRELPADPVAGIDYHQVELTDQARVLAFVETLKSSDTKLRGIIHNASQWLDDSAANMNTMYQLHVLAPYLINFGLAELVNQAPRCDVIHICDDTASRGSSNHVAYAATKSALLNMMLSFAKLYGTNARVNAISPGLLYLKEGESEEYARTTIAKARLAFEPGSEPIIKAVDYLLDAGYVTGSDLVVNGGRHLK